MVKRCALCGIVDNIADVSIHKFPSAVHRRREWVTFVEDQGFHVTLCSRLCSRHFVPGVDYAVGNVERRRLTTTAVPSLVSVYYDSMTLYMSGWTSVITLCQ
ncbi:uncharacterized protein LOC115034868 [Acyrthosiphon pisum]|uniref:THAP-type domain-containing protein n=1 Tax=Acyrthosiphon pisum TaxID=7029 RepID=A0A8R2JV92_ACYPI|nr:uncharacterized protein LOC115034868 [Acyrthosiphon pisum]